MAVAVTPRLVIVSNRVPPSRDRTQLAGGLAVALRDAIASRDTLWFGWSGNTTGRHAAARQEEPSEIAVGEERVAGGPRGVEDVVAARGSRGARGGGRTAALTTSTGRLTFATIDLTEAQYRGFYQGFSNATLWPLLHWRLGLTEFRRDEYAAYREVNEAYAARLLKLLRPGDLVWAHDYHLFPFASALRRHGWEGRIGFFLHVPFPPPPLFRMLPQADELLRDLEAYDVIGMQTVESTQNLNDALTGLGLRARAETFPIGIDPDSFADMARRAVAGPEARRLAASLPGRALILGVDRLDYTKGLPQRFRGFAQLLRRFPDHHGRVTMLQVAPVSRGDVSQYRALRRELDELAGRINGEHAEFDWVPLRYITRTVARLTLAGFYRLARVGLVTPLRDGMNLVAKEFVAAQNPDDPGALVLSRFAGAAEELGSEGALLVNPHDPDATAEALNAALGMGLEERQQRWQGMRAAVWRNTAASWATAFLRRLTGETE
jgi:trehalose 6-phosphate synthase